MLDWERAEKSRCSADEKRQCIPLITEILDYNRLCRREGLLILKETAEDVSHPLLQKGFRLLPESPPISTLNEIFDDYILSSHATGAELLELFIIKKGCIGISSGTAQQLLAEALFALIGDEGYRKYQLSQENQEQHFFEEMIQQGKAAPQESKSGAGEKILILGDDEIKDSLTAIDSRDLGPFLKHETPAVQARIFQNISRKNQVTLWEEISLLWISPRDWEAKAKKIERIFKRRWGTEEKKKKSETWKQN